MRFVGIGSVLGRFGHDVRRLSFKLTTLVLSLVRLHTLQLLIVYLYLPEVARILFRLLSRVEFALI